MITFDKTKTIGLPPLGATPDEAQLETCSRAISELHFIRAVLQFRRGKTSEAICELDRALESSPDMPSARKLRAEILGEPDFAEIAKDQVWYDEGNVPVIAPRLIKEGFYLAGEYADGGQYSATTSMFKNDELGRQFARYAAYRAAFGDDWQDDFSFVSAYYLEEKVKYVSIRKQITISALLLRLPYHGRKVGILPEQVRAGGMPRGKWTFWKTWMDSPEHRGEFDPVELLIDLEKIVEKFIVDNWSLIVAAVGYVPVASLRSCDRNDDEATLALLAKEFPEVFAEHPVHLSTVVRSMNDLLMQLKSLIAAELLSRGIHASLHDEILADSRTYAWDILAEDLTLVELASVPRRARQ